MKLFILALVSSVLLVSFSSAPNTALIVVGVVDAFVVPSFTSTRTRTTSSLFVANKDSSSSSSSTSSTSTDINTSTSTNTNVSIGSGNGLQQEDPILLIGPGFLQLIIAKHLARNGLKPIVVAPQKTLDNYFKSFLKTKDSDNDDDDEEDEDLDGLHQQIQLDSTIGLPEINDPYFGQLKGVIFCAEDAVLSPEIVSSVLDFQDQGQSPFAATENGTGAPTRVIACLPVSNKVRKEKSNSWIPVFNMSDKKQEDIWSKFTAAYKAHACFQGDTNSGSIVRYGSLLGGSVDGPPILMEYGLDEGIYKMSMEQYRDMRERAFDRYKLSGQCLLGDSINEKPTDQESKEKEALKEYPNNVREMFTILGNYPEIDRTNRHTLASGITQLLLLDTSTSDDTKVVVPKEITILSKASSEMNTPEEWKEMFTNPSTTGGSEWPDPTKFEPEKYGIEKEPEK